MPLTDAFVFHLALFPPLPGSYILLWCPISSIFKCFIRNSEFLTFLIGKDPWEAFFMALYLLWVAAWCDLSLYRLLEVERWLYVQLKDRRNWKCNTEAIERADNFCVYFTELVVYFTTVLTVYNTQKLNIFHSWWNLTLKEQKISPNLHLSRLKCCWIWNTFYFSVCAIIKKNCNCKHTI